MPIQLDPEAFELNALSEFADHLDGKRVLEVGCGKGRLTWRYADRPAHVIAIDPDSTRLKQAIADLPPRLSGKIEFHLNDIESFAASGPSPFDTVILAWSL